MEIYWKYEYLVGHNTTNQLYSNDIQWGFVTSFILSTSNRLYVDSQRRWVQNDVSIHHFIL